MTFLFYVPQMASYGGMERHVCLLALLFAREGHRVTLLTTSNSLNGGTRQELLAAGIELREMPTARGSASKARKLIWLLFNALLLRFRRWDLIYTNGQSGLARLVWLAAKKRCRIVHHHHTAGDRDEQSTWHPAFQKTLAIAPELVACSRSTKAHLETVLQRSDIEYLPYLTSVLFSADAVADRSFGPDALLRFGFVGRLVSTKGIDTICALSREPALDSIRWHIHGSGDDYPASFFEPYVNIQYHGPFQKPAECANIFQRLDALALFSRHNEGMPLSLMEAMAAGLPWIATDQGGTSEMAIASENCEIVPSQAVFDEVVTRSVRFVARMRSGGTSRITQRRAYDNYFAPKIVAEHWLDFMCQVRRA